MTPEILRDTRRLLAICEAIRRAEHPRELIRERLRRREADALLRQQASLLPHRSSMSRLLEPPLVCQ